MIIYHKPQQLLNQIVDHVSDHLKLVAGTVRWASCVHCLLSHQLPTRVRKEYKMPDCKPHTVMANHQLIKAKSNSIQVFYIFYQI